MSDIAWITTLAHQPLLTLTLPHGMKWFPLQDVRQDVRLSLLFF